MNDANQNFDKKSLLALANKIISANQGTLNILKETPLCNLKTVQRNAKHAKDPAPLQSMIATISTKFPISVDTQKAKECGIPSKFLYQPDAHQFGRRRCSLDAVRWFMDNVPAPSENVNKAVDVLYRGKREEVNDYYSINWERARVRFGRTPLNRQLIETQTVAFKVPQNQRAEYLMAVVMPDLCIAYQHLDSKVIEDMKQISILRLEAKLSIQSQLRILLDMMDPKLRYIPCLPDYPMKVNKNRYVYASSNHLVQIGGEAASTQSDYPDMIQTVGKATWYLLNDGVKPWTIKTTLERSSFREVNLQYIVSGETERSNIYAKLTFAVMGFPVETTKIIRGFEFTPISGTTTPEMRKNLSNVNFAFYVGEEKIQIKGQGFLANVTRYDSSMGIFVIKPCDLATFKRAFASACVYVKLGFTESKATSIRRMEIACYDHALDNFYKIIGIPSRRMAAIWNKFKGGSKITFSESLEPTPRERQQARLTGTKITLKGGQEFNVVKPRIHPVLPAEFRVHGALYDDFLPPPKRLQAKIQFYLNQDNFTEMMSMAKNNDFNWRNYSIHVGLSQADVIRIPANARHLFKSLMDKCEFRPLLAYIYAFCFSAKRLYAELEDEVKFTWFGNHNLTLFLTSGEVRVVDGQFNVMGVDVTKVEPTKSAESVPIMLPGFKLLLDYEGPSKVMSVNRALSLSKSLPAGAVIKVFMFGREFLLERDEYHSVETAKTIAVRLQNQNLDNALLNLINLNKRAHDEADLSTVPVKRKKNDDDEPGTSTRNDGNFSDVELDDL